MASFHPTAPIPLVPYTNRELASTFEEIAELLELKKDDPFRIQAYSRAAQTLLYLNRPVYELYAEKGLSVLLQFPGIGSSIGHKIEELLRTGHSEVLGALRAELGSEALLMTVPTITSALAKRIQRDLGIRTLKELELASLEGKLKEIPGIGAKKENLIREFLSQRFSRWPSLSGAVPAPLRSSVVTDVASLLALDEEYRERLMAIPFHLIDPKVANFVEGNWVPVWHVFREDRPYTLIFSPKDDPARVPVTIYSDDPNALGRWEIVTATQGALKGKRVVVGEEELSRAFYEERKMAS